MSVPAAASLDEFLEHLNNPSTDDESEIQLTLVAATGVAEGLIGPIVHRSITARLSVRGGAALIADAPVEEVTELAGLRGAPTYESDALDVDPDTGILTGVNGRLSDGDYSATYTAGRAASADEVSEDIRLAVCIIGKHLWETQRGRGGGSGRGGALKSDKVPDEKVPMGYLIPHRARSLLAPYEPLPVA